MSPGIIVLIVVIVLAVIAILLYNNLVTLRNRVGNAWMQISVQLQRRLDLIPNLVETAKGYAAHERGTFDEVTRAHGRHGCVHARRAGAGRYHAHWGA